MAKSAKIAGRLLLEILFPSICLHCRSYLTDQEEKENLLCHNCFDGIKIYETIFYPSPKFSLRAVASYENEALRDLLHYLKYEKFTAAGRPLEKIINRYLQLLPISGTDGMVIIPIPLHKKRLRERGFNQAELIAEILSRSLKIPLGRDLMERTRETKSQIKMKNHKEREINVKGSIRVKPEKKASLSGYRRVILTDDIYTSGSTAKEAARALRQAGVKDITVFVIAKT